MHRILLSKIDKETAAEIICVADIAQLKESEGKKSLALIYTAARQEGKIPRDKRHRVDLLSRSERSH